LISARGPPARPCPDQSGQRRTQVSWIAVRALLARMLKWRQTRTWPGRSPRRSFHPGGWPVGGRGWYRGDCHVHSQRSHGGELTPKQLAAAARELGLDFVAITEHNTADTHGAWGPLAGDDLLVILGQEITTRTGHWLALGIDPRQVVDWRYGVRDDVIDDYLDQVQSSWRAMRRGPPARTVPVSRFHVPVPGIRRGGGMERAPSRESRRRGWVQQARQRTRPRCGRATT